MTEKQHVLHPTISRFIAEHWEELTKPGTCSHLVVEHDADCTYPKGEPCTCVNGPECRIEKS